MSTVTIQLNNLSDTERFGKILGEMAKPGAVICLDGDLGAGKTTLVQAIAKGLAIPEETYVTSPTFTILHEYEGRMKLYHMDFYRLRDSNEVLDLGFDEYFYLTGLTVIEWSKKAMDILPEERLSLEITRTGEESRTVVIRTTNMGSAPISEILNKFQNSAC